MTFPPWAGTACILAVSAVALAGCLEPEADALQIDQVGAHPALPPPQRSLIPIVNTAKARGWAAGSTPVAAKGLRVQAFAEGLDHPRWLYVLPNGDVLVAESNAPKRPADAKGLKGLVMKLTMARAGAAPVSADRITLLRDTNGDGRADLREIFLTNLNSPIGMALVNDRLFIANTDAVVVTRYSPGMTSAAPSKQFFGLPEGAINHHWTKTLVASPDGHSLYVGVGSNSNAGENGIEAEAGRAAIWKIDIGSGLGRPYATGLRNPVGMDFDRRSGKLYAVVNERDELGDYLVPDYLTAVEDGADYGWPYTYWGNHPDPRIAPSPGVPRAEATVPDYALGSHVAPLGLDIIDRPTAGMARMLGRGAIIGEHGSWNRTDPSGYEVVFVPFNASGPTGSPQTLLTGFTEGDTAHGRPAGVALDRAGGLLVADDVGNTVWRVTPAP